MRCCNSEGSLCKSAAFTKYATVAVLFLVGLLVSVDRWMIIGILPQQQDKGFVGELSGSDYWHLELSFLVGYTFTGVWIGYLGDRYTRKYIMCAGVVLWSAFSLAGSFSVSFVMLLVTRSLMGAGQACFYILAPPIVADLFLVASRLRAFAVFLFAIPLGRLVALASLGATLCHLSPHYNVNACEQGSTQHTDWKLTLRINPVLGCVAVIALALIVPDPPRGRIEDPDGVASLQGKPGLKAYLKDLWSVIRNKSLMLISIGACCAMFVIGGITAIGPLYIDTLHHLVDGSEEGGVNLSIFVFCLINIVSGLFGIVIGSECSRWLARRSCRHDTIVAFLGMLLAAPLLYLTLLLSTSNLPAAGVFLFAAMVSLSLQWAPETNIPLYVTVPERRSTAVAIKTVFILLLGQLFPWPVIMNLFQKILDSSEISPETSASAASLRYSLYLLPFICIVGSACFLLATVTIGKDRTAVASYMKYSWHYVPTRAGSKQGYYQSHRLAHSDSTPIAY